jgi:hypothetical protein
MHKGKLLCFGFFPPRRGGAAITNHDICQQLSKFFKVIVYNNQISFNQKSDPYFRNISYYLQNSDIELPPASRIVKTSEISELTSLLSRIILKAIKKYNPDVIFIMHESFVWYLDEQLFNHGKSFLLLCHGSPITQLHLYDENSRRFYLQKLFYFKKVFCVSKFLKSTLSKHGYVNASSVELGLNVGFINKIKRLNLSKSNFKTILHVSNLKDIKNPTLLYNLCKLMGNFKKIGFKIIGVTDEEFALKFRELEVPTLPWINYEAVLRSIAESTFLLVLSKSEGLSRVVREAQLLNTIPIVPCSEVFEESIVNNKTGILLNSMELYDIRQKIEESVQTYDMIYSNLANFATFHKDKYNIITTAKEIYNSIII